MSQSPPLQRIHNQCLSLQSHLMPQPNAVLKRPPRQTDKVAEQISRLTNPLRGSKLGLTVAASAEFSRQTTLAKDKHVL